MKRIIRVSLFACCLVTLGGSALAGYYLWRYRVGYRNIDTCQELQPGISVSELEQALGTPISTWTSRNGQQWVAFENPSIYAGPISAEVESSTGRILTLRCFEDDPPTWTFE